MRKRRQGLISFGDFLKGLTMIGLLGIIFHVFSSFSSKPKSGVLFNMSKHVKPTVLVQHFGGGYLPLVVGFSKAQHGVFTRVWKGFHPHSYLLSIIIWNKLLVHTLHHSDFAPAKGTCLFGLNGWNPLPVYHLSSASKAMRHTGANGKSSDSEESSDKKA